LNSAAEGKGSMRSSGIGDGSFPDAGGALVGGPGACPDIS
jgi:hypothetical protein